MGNICNWLLQGNGDITNVLAFAIYEELLAWQETALWLLPDGVSLIF